MNRVDGLCTILKMHHQGMRLVHNNLRLVHITQKQYENH